MRLEHRTVYPACCGARSRPISGGLLRSLLDVPSGTPTLLRRRAPDLGSSLHASRRHRKPFGTLVVAAGLAWLCACAGGQRPGADDPGKPSASVHPRSARAVPPCAIGGCSGQICAAQPMFSSCEWRPEYACFSNATCERQRDGACGWTPTLELRACLVANRPRSDPAGGPSGGAR